MLKIRNARCASLIAAGVLLFGAGFLTGKTSAGKKTLIHVFAFKQVPGTTPAQMDEMWAATRKLAAESPEIKSIWMGKVLNRGDQWQYGVVMEFDDQAA